MLHIIIKSKSKTNLKSFLYSHFILYSKQKFIDLVLKDVVLSLLLMILNKIWIENEFWLKICLIRNWAGAAAQNN